MPLEDSDVAAIAVMLSPDRLASLNALTGSTRDAIELHQETLSLSASLMSVVGSVEIALRNTICDNLATYFGAPTWLTNPPVRFQWKQLERSAVTKALNSARRAKYAKLSQADKSALDTLAFPHGRPPNTSHLQRAKRRLATIQVSSGDVIAEVTLHFWKKLYSGDYDQTLWRTTLKKTFPNKSLKRPHVAEKLELIYQARNRLAHHEPVLHKRFDDTIMAIEWLCQNLVHVDRALPSPLYKLIDSDFQATKDKADALHARLNSYRVP